MKKQGICFLAIGLMLMGAVSCEDTKSADQPQATVQQDLTTVQTESATSSVADESYWWVDTIFGTGTQADFAVCGAIQRMAEHNPIDEAFDKVADAYNARSDYTDSGYASVISEYAQYWKAEMEESRRRIVRLIETRPGEEEAKTKARDSFSEYCEKMDAVLEVENVWLNDCLLLGLGWGAQRHLDFSYAAYNRFRTQALKLLEMEMILGGTPEFVYKAKA